MYLPRPFSVKEETEIFDFIEKYPFATLISCFENQPWVSLIPLVLDRNRKTLYGHMSRANSHWKWIEKSSVITVLFHGPHTYITPKWYVSGRDVPTWNYTVAQARGEVQLIEDFEGITQILKNQTARFEVGGAQPWSFELPEDLSDPSLLVKAIVGFEIEITELEAKFKLSQNRSAGDQEGIVNGLVRRADAQSLAVRDLMKRDDLT